MGFLEEPGGQPQPVMPLTCAYSGAILCLLMLLHGAHVGSLRLHEGD